MEDLENCAVGGSLLLSFNDRGNDLGPRLTCMDFLPIIRISLLSLERHKLRSFLTMLGIVVGIAAVVASVSFGEGANHMVQAQIANMGTNLLYVFAGSQGRGGVRQGWGSVSTMTVEDVNALGRE